MFHGIIVFSGKCFESVTNIHTEHSESADPHAQPLKSWQVLFEITPFCLDAGSQAGVPTDLYNLDAVPPIYIVSNHEATDNLTTQDGGMLLYK